ncbi:MAG: hypothetical protein A3K22_00075 [Deltaproteobacteria bacterium RBG_16_42_7]|nr:MAG: hypothetical protein A3K22_00075 [Deltaproteobacteria bacterium RBG_16_42_7]
MRNPEFSIYILYFDVPTANILYVFQTELLSLTNKESNQRNWPADIFLRFFAQRKGSDLNSFLSNTNHSFFLSFFAQNLKSLMGSQEFFYPL